MWRFLILLSWRNLWRRPRRTLVLWAAVALGTAAMLISAAFMRGISERTTQDAVANLLGHVQIHAAGYRDNPSVQQRFPLAEGGLLDALAQPPVAAYAARVRVPAVISSERASLAITLVGIDPQQEAAVSLLGTARIEGRALADAEAGELLIGKRLAHRLGTTVGKRVVVMSQDIDNGIADRGFRVAGIFEANPPLAELAYVFTGRTTAQRLLGMDAQAFSEVSVIALPDTPPEALAAALRPHAAGLDVEPWPVLAPMAAARVQLNRGFTRIWFAVVAAAMGIGLVNTFLMAVFERTRELGLFQALGLPPRAIVLQVLCETALVLVAGIAAGCLLGWLAIGASGEGIDVSAFARGAELVGLNTVLPLVFVARDLYVAALTALLLGLAAGLYPAWCAARTVPVEAISRT
ncbi:MAG: ABC transporter permease [Gammaproteobacteria bacterium]